ncbi:MAG: response regulator [Gammaproteobacteria bacterium]|nr:response regulator [Gammaproteobacteria bacterium]
MNHRVLVIDDEPHVVQVMKTFLTRAGFTVDTAANGEEGLRLIRENHPDAVITDYEMPRMDGRALIEAALESNDGGPSLIVLLTSRTDTELRDWVNQVDRIGFVEKPASPRRLVRYIEDRLQVRELEAAS